MWLIQTPHDRAALVARLALGAVMFPHGAQKALGWFGGDGFYATIEHMGEQGMPAVAAILVMAGELLGSIALLVGLLGRVAAAGIALIMLGAIFLVHVSHGFFMNWTGQQAGEGFEYHLLALALALVVVIRGSGSCSIDRALAGDDDTWPHAVPPETWTHVGVTAPDADSYPSPLEEGHSRR
jgi:putative oxidoreductase